MSIRDSIKQMKKEQSLGSIDNIYIGLTGIIAFFVVLPLGIMIWGSFWSSSPLASGGFFTITNYVEALFSPRVHQSVIDTLLVAVGITVVANVVGIGSAWIVGRTNTPFRRLIGSSVILAYFVPGYLIAIAYIFLFSPTMGSVNKLIAPLGITFNVYSYWGIWFAQGISFAGLPFLITVGAFQNFNPEFEEASRMNGAGALKTLRYVTIPMLLPAMSSSIILIFTKSLEIFSVPLFLGLASDPPIRVFSTEIFMAVSREVPPDYGLGTALSVLLLIIAAISLFIQQRITGDKEKYTTITGEGNTAKRYDLGKSRLVVFAGVVLTFSLLLFIPLALLLVVSVTSTWYGELIFLSDAVNFTLSHYESLLSMSRFGTALVNTLFLAAVGSFIAMLAASMMSYFVVKAKDDSVLISRTASITDQITYLPAAVPGIVLAVAFLWFALMLPEVGLYGSIWLLMVAYIVRHLPEGTRTTHSAMSQIEDELEDQARITGASWLRTVKDIIFPLIDRNFLAGYLIIFMTVLKTLSIPIILYDSDSIVLPVLIFEFKIQGATEALAASGMVLFIIMLIVMAVAKYGLGVELYE